MDGGLRKRLHGRRFTVAFDEGGLRCTSKDRAAYVPYNLVVDATIGNTYFGRTLLVLEIEDDEETLKIELANGNPFDVLGAVLAAVTRPHASCRWPALRRNGEPLDVWFARIRRLATGDGAAGYREGGVTIEASALLTTLADETASAEDRAASAHALLELGTDEALSAIARILVTRAVPPLVLIATHLARAGDVLVDDELCADMRALLADPSSHEKRPDDAQARRLTTIRDEAQRDAAAALENAASGSRGRKLYSFRATSDSLDTSRWIGRSWGL